MYNVIGTVRERQCDKHSAITDLVLRPALNGYTVQNLESLKPLADARELKVDLPGIVYDVYVKIFWSDAYRRWIAKTDADTTLINNLDHLPIYGPKAKEGTTTTFGVCPL